MEKVIKMLEQKWGVFIAEETFSKQCKLGNDEYLNVIFHPVPLQNMHYIEELLDWKIPQDLELFYKKYNGLSFFSESMRIYGVAGQNKSSYNSLEIVNQNTICKIKKKNPNFSDFIVFGSFGYYYFCYKRNNDQMIYVIGSRENAIVHTFRSIDHLVEYYVQILIEEYNKDGIKIHKEQDLIDTPMENTTFEYI